MIIEHKNKINKNIFSNIFSNIFFNKVLKNIYILIVKHLR